MRLFQGKSTREQKNGTERKGFDGERRSFCIWVTRLRSWVGTAYELWQTHPRRIERCHQHNFCLLLPAENWTMSLIMGVQNRMGYFSIDLQPFFGLLAHPWNIPLGHLMFRVHVCPDPDRDREDRSREAARRGQTAENWEASRRRRRRRQDK